MGCHATVFICLCIHIAAAPQFLPMFLNMLFPIFMLVFLLSGFLISSISTNFFVITSSFILKTASSHCTNNRKFHLQRSLCWPDTQIRVILISFGSNSCTTILLYWLSPSTCFGHVRAHLQEDRLYIHHSWFNVISYDDCTVGGFVKDCLQSS